MYVLSRSTLYPEYVLTESYYIYIYIYISAGGSLRSPRVTLVNYMGNKISKFVCPNVIIY